MDHILFLPRWRSPKYPQCAMSGEERSKFRLPQEKNASQILTLCPTPRQNVYACARLNISGLFQSHFPVRSKFVLLHAARVFDYFVVIEIAFMDNQAQITETISRLDSEKVR